MLTKWDLSVGHNGPDVKIIVSNYWEIEGQKVFKIFTTTVGEWKKVKRNVECVHLST